MKTSDFGDLRALMNAPYSRQVWEQLCDWVYIWDAQDYKDTVLPYLQGHLHIWDDERRFVPKRWQLRLINGESVQGMEVARSLNLAGWTRSRSHMLWGEKTFPETLFTSTQWSHIARLDLSDNVLDELLLDAMATKAHFDALHVLSLSRLELHECSVDDMVSKLVYASWVTRLKEIDLSYLASSPDQLFERVAMPGLHTLKLRKVASLKTIKALSTHHPTTPLRVLDISGSKDVIYHQINALKPFSGLTHLNLSECMFYASSMDQLGTLPMTQSLHTLELRMCGLDHKKVMALLSNWPHASALRSLDLSGNALSLNTVRAMLTHPMCAQLTELNLFDCHLKDDALSAIIDSGVFTQDAHVNLLGNKPSDSLREGLAMQPELSSTFRL